jgi:hypothetical protein
VWQSAMRVLKFSFFILVIFFLDQVFSGMLGWPGNCIILPAGVFIATQGNLPVSLAVGFSLGFLSDITALRSFPLISFFMIFSVLSLNFISNKYLEFRSVLSMILATSVLNVLQAVFLVLCYRESFSVFLLYPFSINLVIGFLTIIILRKLFKGSLFAE